MILPLNSPPKFTETMFLDTVVYKRHKIKRKSYPWCKDYGNLPAHILRLVTHRFVKRGWGKCFKIQKNAWWLMMYRGCQHNLKDKLQSEINETHRNRSSPSWNKTEQGRKRKVDFRDTIGNLRTTTKFTTTTSVDWEKTGTRTSVSVGKRKLKMQSVGRSTTTLNVNKNVTLWCSFATKFLRNGFF